MSVHTTPDSYTKLLIHSNTSDASTTFVDSSADTHSIAVAGNTHHETDQKKFGKTSMHFDGTGDYLTITGGAVGSGTGDWTVDFWFYKTDSTTGKYLWDMRNSNFPHGGSPAAPYLYFDASSSAITSLNSGMSDGTGNGGYAVTILNDMWHHIAVVRSSGVYTIYVDGVSVGSQADVASLSASVTWYIGGRYSIADYFTGYIDEFRVSSKARWTESFVPPNKPHSMMDDDFVTDVANIEDDSSGNTTVGKNFVVKSDPNEASSSVVFGANTKTGSPLIDVRGSGKIGIGKGAATETVSVGGSLEVIPNPELESFISGSTTKFTVSSGNDSYTKLLIHSDTVSGSTAFVDSSANSHVLSGSGGMEHKTTQKKFGETSMFFDGSDDRMNTAHHEDFTFGTGDFTIDMWYWVTNDGAEQPLLSKGYNTAGVNAGWMLRVNEWDGGTVIWNPTNGASSAHYWRSQPAAITEETWQHIAVVRSAGDIKVYINGTALTPHTETGDPGLDFVDNSRDLMIGHETTYQSGTGAHFSGYLDEVRISKGIARWTNNFTPPTRPYGHALTVDGPKGNLYTVTDSMETHGSGSVFSVNTSDGIPVIEAKDDYTTHLQGSLSFREPFVTPVTASKETKIYAKKGPKPDSFTRLLIHSDTTNGDTNFVDSSVGHYLSNLSGSGEVYHSTKRSKFGKSSMEFSGTAAINPSGAGASNDFKFEAGEDFTIDFWFNWQSASNQYIWYSGTPGGGGTRLNINPVSTTRIWHGIGALTLDITSGMTLVVGQWHHYAMVRSGTTVKVYIDGVEKGSGTASGIVGDDGGPAWIGFATAGWNGNLDEFRVSKGIARWTAAFTPPTEPYETDEYTVLLIHSDTNHRDTHFLDSSETITNRKQIAVTNANHSTTHAKFGNTSMHFDGTDDYLDITHTPDFVFGNKPFTIDFWFHNDSTPGSEGILSIDSSDSTNESILIYTSTTTLRFYSSSGGGSWDISSDTSMGAFGSDWTHYAIVRESIAGDIKLYNNGTLQATVRTTATLRTDTNQFRIGSRAYTEGSNAAAFYMDEFRISNGIARWTSNFTLPKRRYPLNEDKLLIKSEDGVEKTIIAAEPHGVVRQGQVLKATGEDGVQWGNVGITTADHWRLHTSFAGDAQPISSNLEKVDHPFGGHTMGVGMSESSGIFTFPFTGYWLIIFAGTNHSDTAAARTEYQIQTTINNSSYTTGTVGLSYCGSTGGLQTGISSYIFRVGDVTQCKARFGVSHENTGNDTLGSSTISHTYMNFIRLGDV